MKVKRFSPTCRISNFENLSEGVSLTTTSHLRDPWELRRASASSLRPPAGGSHLPCSTEQVVTPAQDTTSESKLALQPDEGGDSKYSTATEGGDSKYSTATKGGDSKYSTATEGGDSKYSTATHDNKMPPNGNSGVTHSDPLNEMPPDGILLAPKPGAGGAPPNGAHFERLANEDQVNPTEDGDTLHKVWRGSTGWGPGDSALWLEDWSQDRPWG